MRDLLDKNKQSPSLVAFISSKNQNLPSLKEDLKIATSLYDAKKIHFNGIITV